MEAERGKIQRGWGIRGKAPNRYDPGKLPTGDIKSPGTIEKSNCASTIARTAYDEANFTVKRRSLLTGTPANQRTQENLEKLVMRTMTAFNIPSCAIAVLSPYRINSDPRLVYAAGFTNHLAYKARGFESEDVESREVDPYKTRFRLASISKVLTAFGVMRAIKKNVIGSLDDHVGSYVSDPFINDPSGELIRFRHLLSHTSGLPEGDHEPDADVAAWQRQTLPVTWDKVREYQAEEVRPVAPRGDVAIYSNYGMQVAGWALSEAVETSYEAWTIFTVLWPLGMGYTKPAVTLSSGSDEVCYYAGADDGGCRTADVCVAGVADTPYTAQSVMQSQIKVYSDATVNFLTRRPCVRSPYGSFNFEEALPSSGWTSTAVDLMLLMRAFVLGWHGKLNTFLPQSSFEEMVMEQGRTADTEPVRYGLGWERLYEAENQGGSLKHMRFSKSGGRCGTDAYIRCNGVSAESGFDFCSYSLLLNVNLQKTCFSDFRSAIEDLLDGIDFAPITGDLF